MLEFMCRDACTLNSTSDDDKYVVVFPGRRVALPVAFHWSSSVGFSHRSLFSLINSFTNLFASS